MKTGKKIVIVMLVLSLFMTGMILAGNGHGAGNGGGNAGSGPQDGTGFGPGDGTETQPQDGSGFGGGNSGNSGGYGPGDGTGNSDGGPGDGTGNGPGDCEEIAAQMNPDQGYTPEEVAGAFGLTINQVYQLIHSRDLETFQSNNQLMILGSEIQNNVDEIADILN